MNALLPFIKLMDWVSEKTGHLAAWLILLACLVSAGNASIRYAMDMSSNAWLELQWYMFSGTVLLGAAQVLKVNEHVRVDVVYGGRSPRTKAWIDTLGLIFFFMPMCIVMVYDSWGFFLDSYLRHEMSSSAGGLVRWPVKLLLPLGFTLLGLQGLAELFKRIGFLRSTYNLDVHYERPVQ
jgi:TRAP-type mannitol/chloroaromatic compound transport system permease small subunit